MEHLQRAAILLSLIEKLRACDSWCGETHVQKTTYFLQELMDVRLGLTFVLYKHGPFSFDLRDELGAMLGDGQLALQAQQYPYGPKYVTGDHADLLKRLYARTIKRYNTQTDFVAAKLGKMGVAELERIATALHVTHDPGVADDVESRAQRLIELKPHVSPDSAREAIECIDQIIKESRPRRWAEKPASLSAHS